MSNKQHRLSIPAPYRKISRFHVLDSNPIVHISPVGRLVPQMIITVLKNGLGENGSGNSGRDDGGGGRRHSGKKEQEMRGESGRVGWEEKRRMEEKTTKRDS